VNREIFYFFLCTLFITIFIAPLASSKPDGLERAAADLGISGKEAEPFYKLFSDYQIPFIENAWLSTSLSGLLGFTLCLFTVFLYVRFIHPKKR
jgi:hypothetical protein